MYKVCAHYQGTIILLEEFECEPEAEEFMLHPYYLTYDDGDDEIKRVVDYVKNEQPVIYPDEMFIEKDSSTNIDKSDNLTNIGPDDLPY